MVTRWGRRKLLWTAALAASLLLLLWPAIVPSTHWRQRRRELQRICSVMMAVEEALRDFVSTHSRLPDSVDELARYSPASAPSLHSGAVLADGFLRRNGVTAFYRLPCPPIRRGDPLPPRFRAEASQDYPQVRAVIRAKTGFALMPEAEFQALSRGPRSMDGQTDTVE